MSYGSGRDKHRTTGLVAALRAVAGSRSWFWSTKMKRVGRQEMFRHVSQAKGRFWKEDVKGKGVPPEGSTGAQVARGTYRLTMGRHESIGNEEG